MKHGTEGSQVQASGNEPGEGIDGEGRTEARDRSQHTAPPGHRSPRFQLNRTWADIVAAGAGTLGGTYKNLTGKSTAWPDFQA